MVFWSSGYSLLGRNRIIIISWNHQTAAAADSEILVFILCSAELEFCASAFCFSCSHFVGKPSNKNSQKLSPNLSAFQVLPLTTLCRVDFRLFVVRALCSLSSGSGENSGGVSRQIKSFPDVVNFGFSRVLRA